MHCSYCTGYGGFLHTPHLTVKWHTRKTNWYYQNSFLPEKKIRKAKLTLFWSDRHESWSKESSIADFVDTIDEQDTVIDLKTDVMRHYHDKHGNPLQSKNNAMRRLHCTIERMDFEEVAYTMGENYVNEKDRTRGKRS